MDLSYNKYCGISDSLFIKKKQKTPTGELEEARKRLKIIKERGD